MAFGTGIFLIAVGAILRFAVTDKVDDVNLATVGLILMIVGAAGVVLNFFWASMWRRDAAVVERRPVDPRY